MLCLGSVRDSVLTVVVAGSVHVLESEGNFIFRVRSRVSKVAQGGQR